MKIKATIEKIPGGMMLIPLLLGACIKTFQPGAGNYFGSFTGGLISGTVPILGVWFFCMGASVSFSATPTILRKSGTLVLTKVLVAWIVTLIFSKIIPGGSIQTGFFAGLSVLAIVSCMDMTNGGLYAAVMQQYGSKEEAGAFILMSLESGPLVSMVVLGSVGAATFPLNNFIGAVIPFVIGITLGNLDPDFKTFFTKATDVMIPFFGFALGNTIDLSNIFKTGLLGIILGLAVIVITGIPLILSDKFIGGGSGVAGLAASSSAGAAVANPVIIAGMAPQFAPVAAQATALVATSVIVTSILVPILTSLLHSRVNRVQSIDKVEVIN